MKKLISLLLVSFLVIPYCISASDGVLNNKDNSEKTTLLLPEYSMGSSNSEYELPLMNFQLDVLGIVFFGPQVNLDFQFADLIAVGPSFRWSYAGVFAQAMNTDWWYEGRKTELNSYSFGIQAKVIIPIGAGRHRPYIGVGMERYRDGRINNGEDERGDLTFESKGNNYILSLGYRVIKESGFNYSIGIGIGIKNETELNTYYDNGDAGATYDLDTKMLGMLNLTFGWPIGN